MIEGSRRNKKIEEDCYFEEVDGIRESRLTSEIGDVNKRKD